jgi:excisionase family DNA binding protein
MSTMLTGEDAQAEVKRRIWEAVKAEGTPAAVARKWGISFGYLSDVLSGRRNGGRAILKHIGMIRVSRDTCAVGRFYSTYDVAAMFGCSVKLVTTWADSGRLTCHRLPGSNHRRFYAADVAAFARKYDWSKVADEIEGQS